MPRTKHERIAKVSKEALKCNGDQIDALDRTTPFLGAFFIQLLENQLLNHESSIQRIALTVLAIFFAALLAILGIYQLSVSSPYVRDVMAHQGDSVQGHAIFLMNCAGCHGTEADGRVGPSLREVSSRKSKVSIIHQVTSGKTPPMPEFQPSAQEMADLLSYLNSL